jgi:carbon-monoxide dehydrogenase medium subunit
MGRGVMTQFDYVKPTSLEHLVQELSQVRSLGAILAGGTDLLVKIRGGMRTHRVLFDVNDLQDLIGIEDKGDFVRIGACTRIREVGESETIKSFVPFLASAANQLGSPQIRNRATIGGNIISASPAADTVLPLMASGAKIRVKGAHGEREIVLDDFMKGPGQTDIREGEVLVEINIPKLGPTCRNHFLKVGRRRAMAISVVNLAGWMKKNGNGMIDDVRIVLGAVAPTAVRAKKSETFLRGKPCTEEVLREAARMAGSECQPINDIRATEFGRRLLVEAWTYRLLRVLST